MAARAGQPGASPCSSLDYHIEAHDFLYSVPRALICAEVEVCVTARTVGSSIAANASPITNAAAWAASRHGPRPHAQLSPALRRMDAGSVPPLGRRDRAKHRGPDQRRARQPAASRTGVPHLSGSIARASPPWAPASSTMRRPRTAAPPCSITPICTVPATIVERKLVMLAHPTLDQLNTLGLQVWPRDSRNSNASPKRQSRSRRMARSAAKIRMDATPTEAA
jgi:hypothetical protein